MSDTNFVLYWFVLLLFYNYCVLLLFLCAAIHVYGENKALGIRSMYYVQQAYCTLYAYVNTSHSEFSDR